ncbi:MAG: proline dehydrogenase family protein [Mycobacteriales bacterium]
MLRRLLLSASGNGAIEKFTRTSPFSRPVVRRFVAGDTVDAAMSVTSRLLDAGLLASLDHLGEHTTDRGQAEAVVTAYLTLLARLESEGLTAGAEVSLKLSAIGQSLDADWCVDNAMRIVAAAVAAGTTVTFDMEDHTTTESTLEMLRAVRQEHPSTGAVIQSYLHRSGGDIEDLINSAARVRLCKGAYREPASVAFQSKEEVDANYARLLARLMRHGHYPMIATHDPRLISIAGELARRSGRQRDTFEYQMLYGVRPQEQRRLAADGYRVRVYVPYGKQWYAYLVRRLAERPANVAFFLRALASQS